MADKPDDPPDDYETGYGKPPKNSQYKPGQSGNPRGRPKGSPTSQEAFLREGSRIVTVQIGGKIEKFTRTQAHWHLVYASALKGNLRASSLILQYELKFSQTSTDSDPQSHGELGDIPVIDDAQALEIIKTRLLHIKPEEKP